MNDDYALGFRVAEIVELAGFTVIDDVSGVATVRINSGKHLHESRLTGTVFATNGMNFAALDLKTDVIECHDAREFFRDGPHRQNRVGHRCSFALTP